MMIHVRRLAPLLLSGILIAAAAGCTSQETPEETGPTTATVTRGDITVEVTASGNLDFSKEEELAFDMAGTVEEIFVEEGDSVSEGQVVATLDTADWEEQVRSLRLSVLSARINLEQAEQALDEAESETTVSITGDVVVRDCCDDDQIRILEMQLEQAQLRLEDAEQSLADQLDQSPEVAATFDGFVTQVSVEGGDEVFSGSVAVVVADPDQFEALILVSENDIGQVTQGTEAQVSVDALSNVVLPAEVTHIAPTASISSGVVNYEVTIQVASLQTVAAQMQQQMAAARAQMQQQAQQQAESGELPQRLQDAVDAGEMTEEEAQAVLEQMQAGPGMQSATQFQRDLGDLELRQGMSVTVTLYPAQKSDVLIVPNAAISVLGGRHVVTVVADDGSQEQRGITTGISDWQNTEVVDGLSEGEVVVVPEGAVSTDQFRGPGGAFFMGGGGGPRG
jgi:RND family efflux transporter MFP subunit